MHDGKLQVAVIGAAGQLGRELTSQLPGRVTPLTRADAELTDPAAVRTVLASLRPQVVVNGAAYNLVDRAEDEPEAAFAVNALAVRRLAEACRDLDARLVHFSTDYVFGLGGDPRQPLTESSCPGPVSVYGASKLAGEYFVRSICPRHLVVRTCGLYGRLGGGGKGGNFVRTMLRLAAEGKPIRVVDDQVCTPSYTADVAEGVVALLARNAEGLVHLTNAGQCSWYEFARAIFDLAGVNAHLSPISTREYGSKARRPAYSVLASERTDVPKLRAWQEALADFIRNEC